ncbi:cytochrome P450 [Streptomyces sp. NPDC003691]
MKTLTTLPGPRRPDDVLRALAAFRRSVPEGLTHLHDGYGPISSLGVRATRWVFLFGREANELVLTDPERFRFAGGYEILRPIAGSTALVLSDGPEHRRRREAVHGVFQREATTGHLALVLAAVDAMIDTWRPGNRIDVYAALRAAVRDATVEAFGGPRLLDQSARLGERLERVHGMLNDAPLRSLLTWNLPLLRDGGPRAALAAVDTAVRTEIRTRRRAADPGDDLIGAMLRADPAMTDTETRDMFVSLLIASYDPVSAALGWAVHQLLADPGRWERIRAEAAGLPGRGPVDPAGLRRLGGLSAAVQETLRMHPPVVACPRRAAVPFTFAGHRLPAGTRVLVSQYVTQHDPADFPAPYRFRPERWDKDRDGYLAPRPYAYLPFGTGTRRCLGGGLASVCVPAVLARLARRVDLRADAPPPRAGGIAAHYPRDGVMVRVVGVRAEDGAEARR